MSNRKEEDALGKVEVPKNAYYGSFTQRAKNNFNISGEGPHPALIESISLIKKACAGANYELKLISRKKMRAISGAVDEIQKGMYQDQFIIDPYQAGAGTPIHMNVNEVIANRATEILKGKKGDYLVHPNDDVNMGQSSNNVIPSAFKLAALVLSEDLIIALEGLETSLRNKSVEFSGTLKTGRTHMQDAVPITLEQEFEAYHSSIKESRRRIQKRQKELKTIGLGGNAIGTGINTKATFSKKSINKLSEITDYNLKEAKNHIHITQTMVPFVEYSSALRSLSLELNKLSNDLILYSSQPFSELILPEVEPGSSIMPGKVNPSIPECVKMVCSQVIGNDSTITHAASQGQLDMNVMAPVIGHNLLKSIEILTNSIDMLREKCINGLRANKDKIKEHFENSTSTATVLSPYLGYHVTAKLVKEAKKMDVSIREAAVYHNLITEEEADDIFDSVNMTNPKGFDKKLAKKVKKRKGYKQFIED